MKHFIFTLLLTLTLTVAEPVTSMAKSSVSKTQTTTKSKHKKSKKQKSKKSKKSSAAKKNVVYAAPPQVSVNGQDIDVNIIDDGFNYAGEEIIGKHHGVSIDLIPDTYPTYPGGMDNLMRFIGANIIYPEQALKANATGRMLVQFIVTKDGNVRDAKVIKSTGNQLLDNEGLRVVNLLSGFTPAYADGQPVDCLFNLPLTFKTQ